MGLLKSDDGWGCADAWMDRFRGLPRPLPIAAEPAARRKSGVPVRE